jgi:hypothetical protein
VLLRLTVAESGDGVGFMQANLCERPCPSGLANPGAYRFFHDVILYHLILVGSE